MTTYVHGTAAAILAARAEAEQLRTEGRKLTETVKALRERNANLEAKIAEERERLEDKRATLTRALADLEAAQAEADTAIREAEHNAPLITELAYNQARALAERAYRSGYDKGRDRARAQHAVLSRLTPAPRKAAA